MTTTTKRSTKLELLRARESELAIAVDEARARVAAYPEQLHEARSRAIYAKPNVRPGAELNSEVSKLNAKERKDVDGLRTLEADLSACRGVLAIEAQRVAEEETAAAREQTEELHAKEEAIWKEAGSLIAEFATCWNAYVQLVEESHRFASANGLESSEALAVTPGPDSFKAFVDLILTAALDEEVRAPAHEVPLIDSGVFRGEHGVNVYDVRPAGSKSVEVRRRLDQRDVLFSAVPDLRSVVLALRLG
jgi:hypothetical protein